MRLIRSCLLFVGACLLTCHLSAQTPAAKKAPESYEAFVARLKAAATHERYDAAMLGLKVESLETGKVIYEQNADKLLKPASNGKMYTGALALDRLGPDFRIRTSFYAEAAPDKKGNIKGDLVVYGRGDPSYSHRFNDGDYQKPLDELVDALVKAGVKNIKGDLVGDESFFNTAPYGNGWAWDDLQEYYGAEVSALTFQENTVDLVFKPGTNEGDPVQITTKPETTYLNFINRATTTAKNSRGTVNLYRPVDSNDVYVFGSLPQGGTAAENSVAVHHAAKWFVSTLRDELARHGIKVQGGLRTYNWLDRLATPLNVSNLVEVAYHESRPAGELVKGMMKPSQNLYAQLLLLQVGEKARPAGSSKASDNLGLDELEKFLAKAGVKPEDVLMEEGSGLSRSALLKPSASVKLLKFMQTHPQAKLFEDSLPIAGVDGTLRSRFKGTPSEKNLHGKTGSLRYVNSLSGYVTNKAGEKLVFSIMSNNFRGDGRGYSDAIAALLATMEVKSSTAK